MNFIIKPPSNEKQALRVVLTQKTVDDIKKYCEWDGIKKKDHFIEECIKYVLREDNHWKEICKKEENK